MSAECQKQTYALQQKLALFGHLVGMGARADQNIAAKRPNGIRLDDSSTLITAARQFRPAPWFGDDETLVHRRFVILGIVVAIRIGQRLHRTTVLTSQLQHFPYPRHINLCFGADTPSTDKTLIKRWS
jgi:hypothetical protein